MSEESLYDIIVIGAGPAGLAAALYAHRFGLKTLLLEKEKFPRDKICGDAISGKSVEILKELNLYDRIEQLPSVPIYSVTFSSPNRKRVNIPFLEYERYKQPAGLVIRRTVFDHFLFKEVQKTNTDILEDFTVREIIRKEGYVTGVRGEKKGDSHRQEFRGKIVLGADGFNSIIARQLGFFSHQPEHWVVALRRYYKGVEGLDNRLELHFIDAIIPGYFWIFPADDGQANVGIGMLQEALNKHRLNLRQALQMAMNSPDFKARFKNAVPLEEPRGWNLPVGSSHRKNYGNGFLILGDAAGLIDPFTGEGIGNALVSGREAVSVARIAIEENDFSEQSLARYDRNLWNKLGPELNLSTKLQRLGRHTFLLNLVVDKAARNPDIRQLMTGMIANEVPKKTLTNPLFYMKLFLR